MATTQLDASRQVKDGSVTNDKLAGSIPLNKLAEAVLQADGGQALTADWNAGAFNISSSATPSADNHLANVAYVRERIQGLDAKDAVRVATVENGAMATAFAAGQVVDGVTLATSDRILIKNQTNATENGIYTVNATGAPTRATDADSNDEVTANLYVFVSEGNPDQADSGWTLSNNGAITLGTTPLTFAQFSRAGTILGGNGLTKTGNTLDVVSGNTGIAVNADDIALTLAADSLLDITDGLRLARGGAGEIIVVNASGVPTYVTLTGDVAIDPSGNAVVSADIVRTAMFTDRETPTGATNGTNTVFTLAAIPVTGSEHVFLNGILQDPGAGNDYTIVDNTITYAVAPVAGDKIRVSYRTS